MRLLLTTCLALSLFACGGSSSGAKSPAPATIDDQVAMGQKEFSEHCASCHGDKAQGGDKAPALIGPHALDEQKTAKELFDYSQKNMPPNKAGSLSDDEYWAISAYLIKSNGFPVSAPLTPANAESVKWSR
jgi:mono/diheme cytochrome c family protein